MRSLLAVSVVILVCSVDQSHGSFMNFIKNLPVEISRAVSAAWGSMEDAIKQPVHIARLGSGGKLKTTTIPMKEVILRELTSSTPVKEEIERVRERQIIWEHLTKRNEWAPMRRVNWHLKKDKPPKQQTEQKTVRLPGQELELKPVRPPERRLKQQPVQILKRPRWRQDEWQTKRNFVRPEFGKDRTIPVKRQPEEQPDQPLERQPELKSEPQPAQTPKHQPGQTLERQSEEKLKQPSWRQDDRQSKSLEFVFGERGTMVIERYPEEPPDRQTEPKPRQTRQREGGEKLIIPFLQKPRSWLRLPNRF